MDGEYEEAHPRCGTANQYSTCASTAMSTALARGLGLPLAPAPGLCGETGIVPAKEDAPAPAPVGTEAPPLPLPLPETDAVLMHTTRR